MRFEESERELAVAQKTINTSMITLNVSRRQPNALLIYIFFPLNLLFCIRQNASLTCEEMFSSVMNTFPAAQRGRNLKNRNVNTQAIAKGSRAERRSYN